MVAETPEELRKLGRRVLGAMAIGRGFMISPETREEVGQTLLALALKAEQEHATPPHPISHNPGPPPSP